MRGPKQAENVHKISGFLIDFCGLCGWIKGFPLRFLDFSQVGVLDFSCVTDSSIIEKKKHGSKRWADLLKLIPAFLIKHV